MQRVDLIFHHPSSPPVEKITLKVKMDALDYAALREWAKRATWVSPDEAFWGPWRQLVLELPEAQ